METQNQSEEINGPEDIKFQDCKGDMLILWSTYLFVNLKIDLTFTRTHLK